MRLPAESGDGPYNIYSYVIQYYIALSFGQCFNYYEIIRRVTPYPMDVDRFGGGMEAICMATIMKSFPRAFLVECSTADFMYK